MPRFKSQISAKPRFNLVSASGIIGGAVMLAYVAVRIFAASGSASLSLAPSTETYAPGQAFDVQVMVNTGGDPVNAVEADFTYPSSKLQFQSIDATASSFSIGAPSTGGGGTVSIARGSVTALNGTGLVATVHFTALAAGTATLSFANTSHVVSSADNMDILASTSGASYTISTPATPTPTQTPTPTTTHTPAPTMTAKTPTPKAVTPKPSPTASSSKTGSPTPVAAAASPSPSSSVAASMSPGTQSSMSAGIPVSKMPKHTNILGIKVAGIPLLILAIVALLALFGGIAYLFYRREANSQLEGGDQALVPSPTPAASSAPPAITPGTPGQVLYPESTGDDTKPDTGSEPNSESEPEPDVGSAPDVPSTPDSGSGTDAPQ